MAGTYKKIASGFQSLFHEGIDVILTVAHNGLADIVRDTRHAFPCRQRPAAGLLVLVGQGGTPVALFPALYAFAVPYPQGREAYGKAGRGVNEQGGMDEDRIFHQGRRTVAEVGVVIRQTPTDVVV